MKKTIIYGVAVLLITVFAISCQRMTGLFEGDDSQYAYILEYEKENRTMTQFAEGSEKNDESSIFHSSTFPTISKERIKIGIFNDGTSEWLITNLVPENEIIRPTDGLVDERPQTKTTKILMGVATYYDEAGNELHSQNINIPSLSTFLEAIREKNMEDAYRSSLTKSTPAGLTDVETIDLSNNYTAYVQEISGDHGDPNMVGYEVCTVVENSTKRIVGEEVYDIEKNLVYRKVNKYSDAVANDFQLPEFSKIQQLEQAMDGEYYEVITTEKYSNVKVTDNTK